MADLSKELNKELSKDFAYCEDALGRAENAIGNLPSAQPELCEDAVSRKMVMDAITASTPYCVVPDDYHISVVDMEFRISTLPSVQPELRRGEES